jgi:hypothetical protein
MKNTLLTILAIFLLSTTGVAKESTPFSNDLAVSNTSYRLADYLLKREHAHSCSGCDQSVQWWDGDEWEELYQSPDGAWRKKITEDVYVACNEGGSQTVTLHLTVAVWPDGGILDPEDCVNVTVCSEAKCKFTIGTEVALTATKAGGAPDPTDGQNRVRYPCLTAWTGAPIGCSIDYESDCDHWTELEAKGEGKFKDCNNELQTWTAVNKIKMTCSACQ